MLAIPNNCSSNEQFHGDRLERHFRYLNILYLFVFGLWFFTEATTTHMKQMNVSWWAEGETGTFKEIN